jgi:hypothetical protein
LSKHFITGAAQSVTNSVERLTALRKDHPEWNEALSPKDAARERLARPVKPIKSAGDQPTDEPKT